MSEDDNVPMTEEEQDAALQAQAEAASEAADNDQAAAELEPGFDGQGSDPVEEAETQMVHDEELPSSSRHLAGALRNSILGFIRNRLSDKGYVELLQREQEALVADVTDYARIIIREMVDIISAEDRPTLEATLESVQIKGGVKAVVTFGKADAHIEAIYRAQGKSILVVVTDAEAYTKTGDAYPIQKDQGDIVELSNQTADANEAARVAPNGQSMEELEKIAGEMTPENDAADDAAMDAVGAEDAAEEAGQGRDTEAPIPEAQREVTPNLKPGKGGRAAKPKTHASARPKKS